MALDAFNSVGGYTVSIPPRQIIDATGAITAPSAQLGNVTIAGTAIIAGDTTIIGNVSGASFTGNVIGNLVGNVQGSIVSPGSNTDVIFNNSGVLGGSNNFTFNNSTNALHVSGQVQSTGLQLSAGNVIVSTTEVIIATTISNIANQVLHSKVSSTVSSLDYTVIATDPVGNNRQTTKLYATVYNSEVGYLEFSTIDIPITSPGVGDFSVAVSGNSVQLLVNPLVNNQVNYKIHITSYAD